METYDVLLTQGHGNWIEYWTIWIDLDQNKAFSHNEAFYMGSGVEAQSQITIPASATLGTTLMRVAMKYRSPADPCWLGGEYGEVEDYMIKIVDNSMSVQPVVVADYCESKGDRKDEDIAKVQVGNFINASTAQTDYTDFTVLTISVEIGETYDVILTEGHGNWIEYWTIWIDLDQNKAFSHNEAFYMGSGVEVQNQITIPVSATLGTTLMRVAMKYGSPADPCWVGGVNSEFGEVEDYTVQIVDNSINEYYGTNVPSFAPESPSEYELFDSTVTTYGHLESFNHEYAEEPGAGKFIFNRIYRSIKHGLKYGQQFGVFGSWLTSFGNNSIEGGLWVNPKTAGPHYYPTLHLAGIGDMYHICNDVQMGSGLYERFIGDKWLTMIQVSNKVLTVPGVNIAFDKEQESYDADNGIWLGSGWTYLNLDHPRSYKFWISFIESYDYQGPINGYMPEHFNWINPDKINDGSYAKRRDAAGDKFGTFATMGSCRNGYTGNERIGMKSLDLGNDTYYVPLPHLPNYKEREYLLAHAQSAGQSTMESYSSALKSNTLSDSLIPTTIKNFTSVYENGHYQLKIKEDINGEEHLYMIVPPYKIGFDNSLGYVDWKYSTDATVKEAQRRQNGYAYVRKLADKWERNYNNHPHLYKTELIEPPDAVVRVPRVAHKFFSYKERDTSHPDFKNWDTTGKKRYQTKLQNGSIATYVWFKFNEQPAVKTAQQNHPETYTNTYLETLQSYIENLHRVVNKNSSTNPTDPVFINYRGNKNPGNKDLHLARIDAAQMVDQPEGFEIGYVPVVISVYHPEENSSNGSGLIQQPATVCANSAWTNTYHPVIRPSLKDLK